MGFVMLNSLVLNDEIFFYLQRYEPMLQQLCECNASLFVGFPDVCDQAETLIGEAIEAQLFFFLRTFIFANEKFHSEVVMAKFWYYTFPHGSVIL